MIAYILGILIGAVLTLVIRRYVENTPVRRLMAERRRAIRNIAMNLVIERGYRFNYTHDGEEHNHICAMCHAEVQYMAECSTRTALAGRYLDR